MIRLGMVGTVGCRIRGTLTPSAVDREKARDSLRLAEKLSIIDDSGKFGNLRIEIVRSIIDYMRIDILRGTISKELSITSRLIEEIDKHGADAVFDKCIEESIRGREYRNDIYMMR